MKGGGARRNVVAEQAAAIAAARRNGVRVLPPQAQAEKAPAHVFKPPPAAPQAAATATTRGITTAMTNTKQTSSSASWWSRLGSVPSPLIPESTPTSPPPPASPPPSAPVAPSTTTTTTTTGQQKKEPAKMMEYAVFEHVVYEGSVPRGVIGEEARATNCLYEPSATRFVVRSPAYLQNGVKVPSAPSIARFVAGDLLASEGKPKLAGVCALAGAAPALAPERKFVVINWQLPAAPPFSFVLTYALPTEDEVAAALAAAPTQDRREAISRAVALVRKFVAADTSTEWRNSRFKLVTDVVEGPWVLRRMAPSNQATLIGTKIATTYTARANYLEVDIDITSSRTANGIWALAARALASSVIDLAFVLQANTESELPETVLGAVRICRVNLGPHLFRIV